MRDEVQKDSLAPGHVWCGAFIPKEEVMKEMMRSQLVLCGLLCLGLGLSACNKDKESGEETETEVVTEEPTIEEPATEEPVVEEPVAQQDAGLADAGVVVAEVDEALFITALYEATCVQGCIEDTEKQKSILDEVYARYGFDEESFKAANEKLGEQANVQSALKLRMEKCTSVEVAEGFAKAGDAAEETTEEDKKEDAVKKPAPKFSTTGAYVQRGVRMGSFNQGELRLSFSSGNTVSGQFKIKADTVLVKIPLRGRINKDGSFTANGQKGANNSLRITGNATTKKATGSISGKINGTDVRSSMNAQK